MHFFCCQIILSKQLVTQWFLFLVHLQDQGCSREARQLFAGTLPTSRWYLSISIYLWISLYLSYLYSIYLSIKLSTYILILYFHLHIHLYTYLSNYVRVSLNCITTVTCVCVVFLLSIYTFNYMHTISIITAGRLPRGDGGRGRDGLVLGKQRVRTIRTGKRNSRLSIDLSYQYFSISHYQ